MSNRPTQSKRRAQPKGRQPDTEVIAAVAALMDEHLDGLTLGREHLLAALHVLQDHEGHISTQSISALAHLSGLAQAEIYEVASFYAHFDVVGDDAPPPASLNVRVCDGIACQGAGADALSRDLDKALGGGVRVTRAPCVGACHRAPVAVAGQNRIAPANRDNVLAAVLQDRTRAAVPAYTDLDAYRQTGGYARASALADETLSPATILDELDAAKLRGMGGAGFKTADKWRFLDGTPKPRAVVVNADEGEPGTFKDHHILTTNPHQMLEGALIAARVVDADDIHIYLRDEYADARAIMTTELASLEAAGLTLGVRFHLHRGAGAYICGEETALLESIEGNRPLPRIRPPYPSQSGLFGRPTLINNVETLYWVADIAKRGAQAFIDEGRPRFYSVSGRVKAPGVKRAPRDITVRHLIDEHAGGMADGHTLKAFLPGGASGGLFPARLADTALAPGAFEEIGGFVGSAAVVVFSDADDMPAVIRNLLAFFTHESCGQCTPCRVGCEKLLALTEPDPWDDALIRELAQVMRDGSICGLGQAAPNPLITWLDHGKEADT